jgi:hypothetical protein
MIRDYHSRVVSHPTPTTFIGHLPRNVKNYWPQKNQMTRRRAIIVVSVQSWMLVSHRKIRVEALSPLLPIFPSSSSLSLSSNLTRLNMSTPENPRIIALFDVDGTLTIPRGEITHDMMDFMMALSQKITVGIVGGSDLPKQEEQLGENIATRFPYNFSQNGLVAYKNGILLESQTIAKFLGEDNIKRIINWVLKYLSELDIPVKVRPLFLLFVKQLLALSHCGNLTSVFLPPPAWNLY